MRATSSGTPDQGTASRSRGCSRRWTTTGKRNMERSMVGLVRSRSGSSRVRASFREGVEMAGDTPFVARHADLTSTCARAARKRARPSERTNPTNERTDVERKPGEEGTQPPRRIRATPRRATNFKRCAARAHLCRALRDTPRSGCAQKQPKTWAHRRRCQIMTVSRDFLDR